jgi:hypothetical protein
MLHSKTFPSLIVKAKAKAERGSLEIEVGEDREKDLRTGIVSTMEAHAGVGRYARRMCM